MCGEVVVWEYVEVVNWRVRKADIGWCDCTGSMQCNASRINVGRGKGWIVLFFCGVIWGGILFCCLIYYAESSPDCGE